VFGRISFSCITLISAISPQLFSQDLATSQKYLNSVLAGCNFNGGLLWSDEYEGKISLSIGRILAESPDVFNRASYRPASTPGDSDYNFMFALARNNAWSMEPRWVVVDKNGRVVFSSTEIPTEEALLEQLIIAGIQEISEILKNFLKENPNREDAMMKLLHHQYEISTRKLKKYLIDNGDESIPWPKPELMRPLSDTEDEEIWSEFAKTLELAVNSEAWTSQLFNPQS